MAYGVDRYPNPPGPENRARVYYEYEDGDLVRRVERDDEEEEDDEGEDD